MLHELRQFISDKQLFYPNEKILLTVSGGIDSVVLFHLFLKAGFSFGVAHCNFSLRGSESDEDEVFVSKLANQNKIPLYIKRFDTTGFAAERSLSIQLAARELRYKWFEEIADLFQYKYIATAHQLNDVIETSLINLSRGTGIAGLHGIPEKNGRVIRPLLFSDRDSIHKYALDQNLVWREDSSNREDKYARNAIRNKVVPVLKNLNPNLEETFKQTTERFKGVESFFNFHINQYKKQLLIQDGTSFRISPNRLDSMPEPLTILTEILIPFGFNIAIIKIIYQKRFQISGKKYYAQNYILFTDRDIWLIVPYKADNSVDFEVSVNETDEQVQIPGGSLSFQVINPDHFQGFSLSKTIACISMDQLTWPLTIRNWREGDRFQPFGMNGMKKLSDFMIDEKIPSPVKKYIPILITDNRIIWLIGYRMGEQFKITDSTKKILVCTYHH